MKTYILVDGNFEAISCGTDQLILVDGRFNAWNILQVAKKHINSFEKNFPVKFETFKKACYIARFDHSEYKNGKYYYKTGLICL